MSTFDVVVVGGGPAGMMAAARAAQYGARAALIEKNTELGRKLMITGRGRCNFARAQDDPRALAKDYRRGGDFLLPALTEFGAKETVAFFLRRGLVSAEERGHRLYPREGQDASSVVNALWTALKDGGVEVLRGVEVRALDMAFGKVRCLITGREEIGGRAFVLATGGLSFPATGSTGDGYRWARRAGHTIVEPRPALCPVRVVERFDDGLAGLKLKNVRVTLLADGAAIEERFGEMDFTPFGVSGAIIMDMASAVGAALKSSRSVTLSIDLKPALEPERLDARIERDFEEFSGDALRFAVRKLLPREIIPEALKKAGLDMGKPCGQTTPEERRSLRDTLKGFTVTPTELLGFRHAIVTSGGVDTSEIDPLTMRSRLVANLYFAGEMIDADGPTGGYNLQMCWSTGFVAGSAAAESLGFKKPSDRQIVEQMERARERRDEFARRERDKTKKPFPAGENGENTQEELREDMTIRTGPTDDAEFTGWKDPREKGTTDVTPVNGAARKAPDGRDFGDRSPRRERDFDDRPPRHDRGFDERSPRHGHDFSDRPPRREYRDDGLRHDGFGRGRDFGERPPRRDRDFDERPPRREYRDGGPRHGGFGRGRDFGDRPPRWERGFDDRPPRREFRDDRPRRDGFGRGRDFGDRPPRWERGFDDRPPRHERGFDEHPPRYGHDFSERPPRREYRDDASRHDGYGRGRDFGERPPRRDSGFDERPPRREFRDDAPRHDGFGRGRDFGERPPRRERGFDERPPRHERGFDERPPRREFRDGGPRHDGFGRGRDFGDRPPRRERDFGGRPGAERQGDAPRKGPRRFTSFQKLKKNSDK